MRFFGSLRFFFSNFSLIYYYFFKGSQIQSTGLKRLTKSVRLDPRSHRQDIFKWGFFTPIFSKTLSRLYPSFLLQCLFPKFFPNPLSKFLILPKLSNLLSTSFNFSNLAISSYTLLNRLTRAPRAGSKHKGKKPFRAESPLRYDNSSYPSQQAFDRYSTGNITFHRVINFEHLDFIGFNQLTRRMRWLIFARLSNPSYPSLIWQFYANLSRAILAILNPIIRSKDYT